MTKKFGQNEKKLKGREAKEKALAEKQQKNKELKAKAEEAYWKEGAQDHSKKEAEKIKKEEKLLKKKEREQLLRTEEESLLSNSTSVHSLGTTRSSSFAIKESKETIVASYSASNIDDALELMTTLTSTTSTLASSVEKHPERRMKAAFAAFEERELPLLKKEFPSLRLSQLQQLLRKRFAKSAENPMNQPHVSYETSADEIRALTQQIQEAKLESFKTA